MSDFPLIKQMINPEEQKKSMLPEGVPYQRFNVRVDGDEKTIHIPLREAQAFKDRIAEEEKITKRILRSILREFRGIQERDDSSETLNGN